MFNLSGKEESVDFEGFEFKYVLKNRAFDTNHLIVVFSGYGGSSDFNYDFLGSLKNNRAYVLWIKDDFYNNNRATYYIDPITSDSNKLEKAVIGFINRVLSYLNINREDCTLLGCSKGGSSALLYGIKYNFTNILLSVPTLLIGSSIAGIIPKGNIRNNAKFILGNDLKSDDIKKLDSVILDEIEKDKNYDRNIYLISSKADPKYSGQVKPFLGCFLKYHNFNFIESNSVLVRTHSDVTLHNAPLILSILGCLIFKLPPSFKHSITYGDAPDKAPNISKKPVLKIRKLNFDDKGYFHPEGVFFIRGLACANYSDFKYIVRLKSEREEFEIVLAKGNNKTITKNYYEDAFVNYDKAYFCTNKHKGLDMSHIKPDVYQLFIEITMSTGEKCEVSLFDGSDINNKSFYGGFLQSVYSDKGKMYYSKLNVL